MTREGNALIPENQSIPVFKPQVSWVLTAIGVQGLHAEARKGNGIRIGHLDTGVSPHASDLAAQIAASLNVNQAGSAVETQVLEDDKGHGTHTASLLVGNTRSRMYIGVAPKARLVSAKVLEGGNSIVRILKGLDWLGEQQVPIGLLCAGLPNVNPVFSPMMRSLRAQNMLMVCPIGNAGNGHFFQPGDDPSVLSVGAIDQNDRVPKFSGSRVGSISTDVQAPDVLAPGVDVPCATRTGGRANYKGTSMAAALVAGVAALLKEAEPEATADELYDAICYGSRPLEEHTRKHACCGILHAPLALEYLRKNRGRNTRPRPERPQTVEKGWRDPRLKYQLAHATVDEEMMAVYILKTDLANELWEKAARSLLQDLVPANTEYIPRGRAVIVSGPPSLHQALINHAEITYASAADAGRAFVSKKK